MSMAAHGARRLLPMAANAAQRRRHRAARRRAGLRLPRAADVERAARSGARRAAAQRRAAARRRSLPAPRHRAAAHDWCVGRGADRRRPRTRCRLPTAPPGRPMSDPAWLTRHARRRAAGREHAARRARTFPPASKRGSSRRGSRARTPTGTSTGSTTSPPTSARRSSAPRISRTVIDVNRDPSRRVALSRPGDDRALSRPTTFDGEPLYRAGRRARRRRDRRAARALLRSLPRGARPRARAARGSASAASCSTTATRSAR